jgi:hypothetical protein
MLSTEHVCDVESDGSWYPKFTFTVPQSLNPRITGLRVYRADQSEAAYHRIHTINFLRPTGEVLSGAGSGGYAPVSAGAYDGQVTVYIPDLSDYTFNNAYRYKFVIGGVAYTMYTDTCNGKGNTVFSMYGGGTFTVDHWDASWELLESTGSPWTVYSAVDPARSGTSGAFCGPNVVITNAANTGINDYSGGVFYFNTSILRRITKNYMRAFGFQGAVLGTDYQARSWKILSPSKGLYTFTDDSSSGIAVEFFDTAIDSSAMPLSPYAQDEASINVHGKFARMINGMLWQADLILNPGASTQETHVDWVSYSMPGCPDATPVSRVFKAPDSKGSATTGIFELGGMPVIAHERAIVSINTRTAPGEPSQWFQQESAHSIGNLAEQGAIEAKGRLFVCSVDGIYALRPNNLAPSDQTPIEILRVSEPINDVYMSLTFAQKQAIKAEYDSKLSEIVFVFAALGAWRYNVDRDEWREEVTARTIGTMCQDEEGNVLAYDSSDKKIYSSGVAESVAPAMRTKVFDISRPGGYEGLLRYLWMMFKSTENITALVLDAENTPSGEIEYGATYYVEGYTAIKHPATTGTEYTTGQAFAGLLGQKTYSVTGTGKILRVSSITFTAQTVEKLADSAPKFRARKVFIELSAAASTNAVHISSIKGE